MNNSLDSEAAAAAAQAARLPTRRRLLAFMATLQAFTAGAATTSASAPAQSTAGSSAPDSISDLFVAFEALLTKHEASLWRCDRLEAWLLAELDHPRVQLPTPAGIPSRHAADAVTIAQHVPPGRRRYRLQQILLRRQQAWIRGARACGLTKAQEQEAALDTAVRDAAATLIAAPARTVGGIRTKLLVLLAVQQPGEAFRASSPWRELRLLLADLDTLAEP
ncbi:hypothetical protein [Methylorubrum extorquens]